MSSVIQGERFTGNATFQRSFADLTLVDCVFEDYTHQGASMTDVVFVGCSFKRVDFYWASMFRSRFVKCELEEVDFRGAALDETVFASCRFLRCDFGPDNLGAETDLVGVSFHRVEMIDCAGRSAPGESGI